MCMMRRCSILAMTIACFAMTAGAVSAATMPLTVVLSLRNKPMLDALVDAQSTPGSPEYHRWLSSDQLQRYFLPSTTQYARTLAILRADGFAIVRTSANRTSVGVRAPGTVVERFLGWTAASQAQPPVAWDNVAGVLGFHDSKVRALAHRALPVRRATKQSSPRYGLDGGYGPEDERHALDLPVEHGYDGRGITVALIDDATFSDTLDVEPYLSYFGIERTGPPTTFVHPKACEVANNDCLYGINNALLDIEHIVSNAPGVALRLYEISNAQLDDIYDAVEAVVDDNKNDIALMDYSECENWTGESGKLIDTEMELGAARGITFVTIAQGISYDVGGSRACDAVGASVPPWMEDPTPRVNWPADSIHALAIGGADYSLERDGHRVAKPATDWFSGGGVSDYFSMPTYQKGVRGMIAGGRNVPDLVGLAAMNGLNPSIYDHTLTTLVQEPSPWLGGTAFSGPVINEAPLVAGIAEIDQMHGGRMGLIADALYDAYRRYGYNAKTGAFFDVLNGCNGEAFNETLGPYCATRGYDQASGIGAIDAYLLGKVLK
jgi:subtilase family serine protease